MSDNNTFLFQVNVTRDCDLRCTHCYISSDKKKASAFMSEQEFTETLFKIADYMDADWNSAKKYSAVDIHVIGGEPSMMGVPFFENTMPAIKDRFSRVNQKVKLSIVSNLLQKRAVTIVKMFDHITTSYEVDSRFTKQKQEDRWMSNCKEVVSEGYNLNINMAMTKAILAKGAPAMIEFCLELGIKHIHFGFFIPSGDGLINAVDVFPPFEDTTDFLIEAAEYYLARRMDDVDLYVNPIESMIESIYRNQAMEDIICPIISGSLDIDASGDTASCLELGGEVDARNNGNVFSSDIQTILNSRGHVQEVRNAIRPKPACMGCDELTTCSSACGVLHNYWNGKGECPGFRGFIKYIRNKVENEGIKPKSEILKLEAIKGSRY
jgi:radical SAM protein with 4Fe4S-binding SPASM domain